MGSKPLVVTNHITCDCLAPEHTLHVTMYPDEPNELVFDICLKHYEAWYKRLWYGIKYICGVGENRDGYFDCTIVSGDELKKLQKLVNDAVSAGEVDVP